MNKHTKHIRFLFFVFSGLVLILLGLLFEVPRYLNIQTIAASIAPFGNLAPVLFVVIHAVVIAALLPALPLTIISGALFGPVAGAVYSAVASVLGASIIFVMSRVFGSYFLHDWLLRKNKKYYQYLKKSERSGLVLTFLVRIIPGLPFNLFSILLGLSYVRFRDFFIGTLFGVVPSTLVLVYFGDSLTTSSFGMISVFASLIVILWLMGIGLGVHFRHGRHER